MEVNNTDLRISIMKRGSGGNYTLPRKRISWSKVINDGVSTERTEDKTEKLVNSSNMSISVHDLLAPNLRMTSMGLCFVRGESKKSPKVKRNIQALQRQDFASLARMNKESPKILLVGSKVIGFDFLADLRKVQDRLNINFNIEIESDPSVDNIKASDFFIFLVALDEFDGVSVATKYINALKNHVVGLSMCSILVCFSSKEGMRERVLPEEYLRNLIVRMQMVSFNYSSEMQNGKLHATRQIVEHVDDYFRGTGLASWAVKCPPHIEQDLNQDDL